MASDPVCGMYVPETPDQLQARRGSLTYYFCSESCVRQFEAPQRELRRLRFYTAWAFATGALILLLMFLAVPLGLLPGLSMERADWVMLALAAPIQFVAGRRFYEGLAHAVRARAANMDSLIALGTTTAFGYSALVTLAPSRFGSATYFDTSVLIIAFILLGRSLEHTMKERATDAVRALASLQPDTARLVEGGQERSVPIAEVQNGARLRIRPGERVPTDCRIVEGEAEIDESIVTGESLPVHKGPGGDLVGASLNTNGSLLVEATRVGNDTMLAQIVDLVEAAQGGKAPIQRLVDAVSAVFVPAVLVVALGSALLWFFVVGASAARAALVFTAVVIIACPCALGLATPAALLVGVGKGAQHGILIKQAEQFERLAKVRLVLFDKTGTLTHGRPEVTDVVPVGNMGSGDVLRLAAAVEAGSEHPLAAAIVRRARLDGFEAPRAERFRAVAGQGVEAEVESRAARAGKPSWVAGPSALPAPAATARADLERQGKTVIAVSRDGETVGLIALSDTLKPGVRDAVLRLRARGIEAGLVTGDNEATARAIAAQAGIEEVHAQVLPQEKAALVEERRRAGRLVAFVGDGINDAPALAAADVGIALGSGTDVAREAGGIVLTKDDPRDVPNAIELARRTVAKVRQNLFWAFVYNVALIPVAALGLLDPIVAGAAMALSSVTVVGNSLTLRRYEPGRTSSAGLKQRPNAAPPQAPRPARRLPLVMGGMASDPAGSATDPVCHMRVDPERTPFRREHAGTTYFFCSKGCAERFEKDPRAFLRPGRA